MEAITLTLKNRSAMKMTTTTTWVRVRLTTLGSKVLVQKVLFFPFTIVYVISSKLERQFSAPSYNFIWEGLELSLTRRQHSILCLFADVDVPVCRKSCSKPAVERILEFGRELYSMSQRLKTDKNTRQHNQQMLEVQFFSNYSVRVLQCCLCFRMRLVY